MHFSTAILVGLGLVAFASTNIGGPPFSTNFWVDTQTQKNHCEGKDVIRCETSAGGSCFAIDICKKYCFKHDKGAACVDMGKAIKGLSGGMDMHTPEAPDSTSNVNIVARDASPQENKHNVCSKDRRSVLICRYGFCSADHYCKNNEECKDGAVFCKSISPSAQDSKSEVRAVADRIEDAPLKLDTRNRSPKDESSYICSQDRASVLKCTYGFCATDYYCEEGHPRVDNPARCKRALTTS